MSENMNEETVKTEAVKSGPITFTPEQQEFFNKTLNAKYADWKKKETDKEKEYITKIQELESKVVLTGNTKVEALGEKPEDIKQLMDQLNEARRVIELGKAKEETFLEKQKALQVENEKRHQELLNERKRNTLMNLANKHKFMSPEHVIKIVGDQIKFNTDVDGFKVFGENGEERYNDQLKPLSLDEFMAEFAAKNPHMVRGAQLSGTGATEASKVSSRKWLRSEIAKLTPTDYSKFREDIGKAFKEGRIIDG